MKKYIIALKELGVNDADILDIVSMFELNDYKTLYCGGYLDLQFKYGIDFKKYNACFGDLEKLKYSLKKANEIIVKSKALGIQIVPISSKRYPTSLKTISTPPPVIYIKGRGFNKEDLKSIGCVGTRNISNFGINAVQRIVPHLVNEGFSIISGLAIGVDTYSHRSCLECGGRTIAVLAHGLDMIYPEENKELANEIIAKGGLLMSEYPVGTPINKANFVKRNRLVSGLSGGIIVFQCNEHSGTMHTVRFAQKQHKKIFCPLPSINSSETQGLLNIINNLGGISIPSTNSYDIVVHELGYKLKDKDKLKRLKAKNASMLINDLKVIPEKIYNSSIGEETSTVSFKADKELYFKCKDILKKKHLSNKDIFNAFLLSLIEHEQ